MVGMESLVQRWFQPGVHDMADDHIEPPPIATLPEPKPQAFSAEDAEALAVEQSARVFAKLKRQIESQQVEITELMLKIESMGQKINFLEAENAEQQLKILEQDNNTQALLSQMDADKTFLGIIRKYLDARDIKATPKKPRNGKPKQEVTNEVEHTNEP